ncbi:hypothetical protein, partial [Pontibacter fetidus]|uniref:hypothetical protein n=1 Tax=Pontibacter fetidus TaxID=2700082 RepID=UPI001F2ADA08
RAITCCDRGCYSLSLFAPFNLLSDWECKGKKLFSFCKWPVKNIFFFLAPFFQLLARKDAAKRLAFQLLFPPCRLPRWECKDTPFVFAFASG